MATKAERLDSAWDRLDEGEYEAALEAAASLLAESPDHAEALLLAGCVNLELGQHVEGEQRLGRVLELEPDNATARLALAWILYETCRFEEALAEVDRVLGDDPDSPDAIYLKALLQDMRGRSGEADDCYRRAARLDPDAYTVPAAVEPAAFDAAVQEALELLPPEFREKIGGLAIIVQDVPSASLLATLEEPAPDLLGLFTGTPLTERTHQDLPSVPEAVYLFKRNLERACANRAELVEEIQVTLLHEIGHYLGMDEEDLEEAGYA